MAKRNPSVPADAAAAAAPESVNAPAGGKTKVLLWTVLVLVLAAGGGGFVAFSQYDKLAAVTAVLAKQDEEAQEVPIEYGEFLEVQGIIVNPAGTDGQRYLMVNVGLESGKARVLEEVKAKEIVVRDQLVKLLSEHTVEELADIERRGQIKEALRAAINGVLRKGEVNRLYFTQYVLQ